MIQHQYFEIEKNKDRSPFFSTSTRSLLEDKQWRYIQKLYHLTPRELQVAKLVCLGLNNEEIAVYLKIQHGTVKTHIRNIYRRTNVKNKIQMLLRFVNEVKSLFAKLEKSPVIPVVDIKKQQEKKLSASISIPQKE